MAAILLAATPTRGEAIRWLTVEPPADAGSVGSTARPTLQVLLDGAPQEVVLTGPVAGMPDGWRLVVYFDPALASPAGTRRAVAALSAAADRLTGVGSVEVVVADPLPEALLEASRDPDELREALAELAELAPMAGRGLDPDTGSGYEDDEIGREADLEAGAGHEAMDESQTALLQWLAAAPPGPRAMTLLQDGPVAPGAGRRDRLPDATPRQVSKGGPAPPLARTLAAEGWTAVVLAMAAQERPVPSHLDSLAEATGGWLVRDAAALDAALERLAKRWAVAWRAVDPGAGRAPAPLEVRTPDGALLAAPRWGSAGTPEPILLARAAAFLEERVPEDRWELEARLEVPAGGGPATLEAEGRPAVATRPWQLSLIGLPLEGEARLLQDVGWELAAGGGPLRAPVAGTVDPDEILVALVEEPATGHWQALPVSVVESRAPAATAGGRASRAILLLPPTGRPPLTGPTRFAILVSDPAVERVEFLLDGAPAGSDDRAPFSATLDLGPDGATRRVTAIASGAGGHRLGEHTLTVNPGRRELAVRIVRLEPRPAEGAVEVEAAVTTPPGAALERVEFFHREALAATRQKPPFRARLEIARPGSDDYVQVVAHLADGRTAEDARLLVEAGAAERLEVNLVELHVFVADKQGRPVADLERGDFRITLRGAERPVERFARADEVPLLVGLVIDTSESMWPLMPDTKQAGAQFLGDTLQAGDRAFVVDFDTRPRLARAATGDFAELARAFAALTADGYTALYDAVIFSMLQFEAAPGRRALVVLTDGDDYKSRYGPRRAIAYGQRLGVPVYVVSLAGITGPPRNPRRIDLEGLTEATGGRIFYIHEVEQLAPAYDSIQRELRSQYTLAFTTDHPLEPQELDAVEVSVPTHRRLEIRTVVGARSNGPGPPPD